MAFRAKKAKKSMDDKTLQQKVSNLPRAPGVYLMKSAKGEVLYVGKAANLRSRVASYFAKETGDRYQIRFLMAKVADVEAVITDTTKEALLLENTLIKKHRPRYNVELKDDKSYVSLKLSVKDEFPRLYITRRIKKDGSLYFGPYARVGPVRETVDFIERHFRLRTCGDHDFANRVRPCLQYQIQRCDAPCVAYISAADYGGIVRQVRLFLEGKSAELKAELGAKMSSAAAEENFEAAARYRDLLQDIDRTLERQKVVSHGTVSRDVIGVFREGESALYNVMMVREGKLQESRVFSFKSHEEDQDLLASFLTQYYEEGKYIPAEILLPFDLEADSPVAEILSERAGGKVAAFFPKRGEKAELLEMARQNARQSFESRQQREQDIQEVLSGLKEKLDLKNLPRRIECYDISNFQGKESVGSLVSFWEGKPDKSRYRHFKIKSVAGSDDFASIYEVIVRRVRKGLETERGEMDVAWGLPDLIVIDGGKGQLNAAAQALKDLQVERVDLISLAKSRLEAEQNPDEKTPLERRHRSEERIFLKNRKDPVFLPPNSSILFLLMQLRDEAHRFGIEHHRKLRKKRTLHSALDEIEGVGTVRRRKLLQHFGSLKKIKAADPETIAQVLEVSLDLAKRITESL
jgi:excinuclease ABC subunit C